MLGKEWTVLDASCRFPVPSVLPSHTDWSFPSFQYSVCPSTSRARAEGYWSLRSNIKVLLLPSSLQRSILGRVPPSNQYRKLGTTRNDAECNFIINVAWASEPGRGGARGRGAWPSDIFAKLDITITNLLVKSSPHPPFKMLPTSLLCNRCEI